MRVRVTFYKFRHKSFGMMFSDVQEFHGNNRETIQNALNETYSKLDYDLVEIQEYEEYRKPLIIPVNSIYGRVTKIDKS